MTSRSLGHRAPLLWLALPLTAGLAAGRSTTFASTAWLLGSALGLALAAVWTSKRAPKWWAVTLAAAMFLAGWADYGMQRARLGSWDTLPPREATVSLRVERVFTQTDPRKSVGLATIVHADGRLHELAGQRIHFTLALGKGIQPPIRSAVVSAIGVLAPLPRDPPADTFEGFLAGAGVNFRLNRGRLLAEEKSASAYYRFCARAARRFWEILGRGIEDRWPAQAGSLRAMMLGDTHDLTSGQHELFMQSGTMHLFAISGLNIGVIATALRTLLVFLRLPRWARFVVGTALLWLFVDITGGSPSAIRAFAMTVFFQLAAVLRRPANLLAAVVAAATAVLLVAPLQVFGASFVMSYGIVAALFLLGLPLADHWLARWTPWRDLPPVTWRRWHRWSAYAWRWLATALAVGVATTLVSLLTSVQFFRLLTPGALLANLVLIPTAMAATLGGFAALLCGLLGIGPAVVGCNHLAALLMLTIEVLVRLGVRLPGAFVPAHFVAPWVGLTALSGLMLALLAGYAANWGRVWGGWWPPFGLVGLALLFGVQFG